MTAARRVRGMMRIAALLCRIAAAITPAGFAAATPPRVEAATARAAAAPKPVSAILIDAASGDVLFARNADIVRRPASLTKMMTLFLAFDALDDGRLKRTDRVKASRNAAAQQPSRLGLRVGSTLSVDEAIRAIAVVSANDVAVALAERIGGSERAFTRLMTAKARLLGLDQTSFGNVTGLPGSNLTTARDMATLSRALLRGHPRGYAAFGGRSFIWRGRRLPNHNHLLGAAAGVDGIKTGYTAEAGYNLAASARRRGRRLIAVVLGERSVDARDRRVAAMLDDGFTPTKPPGQSHSSDIRPHGDGSLLIDSAQVGVGGDTDWNLDARAHVRYRIPMKSLTYSFTIGAAR